MIGYSSWELIRRAAAVLMQAVPSSVSVERIEGALTETGGVVSVHDLHAWSMTGEQPVVSAHFEIDPGLDRPALMETISEHLGKLGIHHSTIQLDCPADCSPCDAQDADGNHDHG